MELAAPPDGLGDGAGGCYFTERSVGVGGIDVAVGAEHFARVLGEVEAVGAPGANPYNMQSFFFLGLHGSAASSRMNHP